MLKQRIITALILAPLAIMAILFLPIHIFQYVIAGVVALGGYEWANMSGITGRPYKIAFGLILLAGCLSLIGIVDVDLILDPFRPSLSPRALVATATGTDLRQPRVASFPSSS